MNLFFDTINWFDVFIDESPEMFSIFGKDINDDVMVAR